MPYAISPAIPSGRLSATGQPSITSPDGELLLRPWGADDGDVLLSAFEDPVIRRWHMRQVSTPEEVREWIASYEQNWQQEKAAQWAITSDGEILGRMALRSMDLMHGVAECAYWVLPKARGAGVAPRALAALAGWSLDEAGFRRIELAHSTRNEPSCRVAEKSGFALEGALRSALQHTDGWHDVHLHARVRGDA